MLTLEPNQVPQAAADQQEAIKPTDTESESETGTGTGTGTSSSCRTMQLGCAVAVAASCKLEVQEPEPESPEINDTMMSIRVDAASFGFWLLQLLPLSFCGTEESFPQFHKT